VGTAVCGRKREVNYQGGLQAVKFIRFAEKLELTCLMNRWTRIDLTLRFPRDDLENSMASSEITRLTSTTNAIVVQLPERKYPGVVVQGDSLQNLHTLACEAQHQIQHGDIGECQSILEELRDILGGYLQSYKEATETAKLP
jgi:hypothetical protein